MKKQTNMTAIKLRTVRCNADNTVDYVIELWGEYKRFGFSELFVRSLFDKYCK
jgi:hypothetical protein